MPSTRNSYTKTNIASASYLTCSEDSVGYRFGFNAMPKENEVYGSEGSAYDFGARIYDSRLGRWLSVDPHASSYPSLSGYSAFANNPINVIDPDGRDIIFITSNGSVRLSKSTLVRTEAGRALWNKYANSKTDDIYIAVQSYGKADNAIARTYKNAQKYSLVQNGKIVIDEKDANQKLFSKMDGYDVSKSKGKKIHMMSLNSDYFKSDVSKLEKETKYDLAESIYHEMKSHIDMNKDKVADADKEHKDYGKTYYGLDSDEPVKGSPAEKIVNQLKEIRQTDRDKETKKNE